MQPLSRADAAARPLHLKHIVWAPGHGPLDFPPALLAAPSHRLLLKLLTSEKTQGLVLGPLLFPTYTPIFLMISFKQELKIPSLARGFQIICPDWVSLLNSRPVCPTAQSRLPL